MIRANEARHLKSCGRAIELAGDLGVRVIQLAGYDVYYETADDSTRGWFLENLFQCVHMAQQYGMMLGFDAALDCLWIPFQKQWPMWTV